MDVLSDLMLGHENLFVIGDFNIHLNDLNDADAIYLLDAMFALGFDEYVKTATHNKGNILDPIFINNVSTVKVLKLVVADKIIEL